MERAIAHALNAVVASLRLASGTVRVETDVTKLIEWVVEQDVPLSEAEALIERAVQEGMDIDLGMVRTMLQHVEFRREAGIGYDETEGGAGTPTSEYARV